MLVLLATIYGVSEGINRVVSKKAEAEVQKNKSEAAKAKAEGDAKAAQAEAEAGKATAEASRAKAEASRAKAEAEASKAEAASQAAEQAKLEAQAKVLELKSQLDNGQVPSWALGVGGLFGALVASIGAVPGLIGGAVLGGLALYTSGGKK